MLGKKIPATLCIMSTHCIIGPPSIPDIQYNSSDCSLCFDAYSHPDHQVIEYSYKIIYSSYNTVSNMSASPCIVFEESPEKFCIFVSARNTMGNSSQSNYSFPGNCSSFGTINVHRNCLYNFGREKVHIYQHCNSMERCS